MKKRNKAVPVVLTWLLAIVLVSQNAQWVYAGDSDSKESADAVVSTGVSLTKKTYADYLKNYRGVTMGTDYAVADLTSAVDASGLPYTETANYDGVTGALLKTGDSITVNYTVQDAGFYYLGFDYYAIAGKGIDILCSVAIDGETLFSEAETFNLMRMWRDDLSASGEGSFETDSNGDEIIPSQVEYFGWQTTELELSDYYSDNRTKFFFSSGSHTVTIAVTQESCAVANVTLSSGSVTPGYAEYKSLYQNKASQNQDAAFKVEAEYSYLKSENGMSPSYDRSSPDVTPNDASNIKVNVAGGYSWRGQNDWISWKITVPEDGFYDLTFHFQQSSKRGMTSIRALYIDGELPYTELANIEFPYGSGWQTMTLSDKSGEAYKIYLAAGEHELKLAAKLGDTAAILESLNSTISSLNTIYRNIIMITGASPDLNRDYYLDSEIPDLISSLESAVTALKKQSEAFLNLTGDQGSEASFLQVVIDQLHSFTDDPRVIPKKLTSFRSNISSLADLLLRMKEQPLTLDYMVFSGSGVTESVHASNFLEKLSFRFQIFLNSFFTDYSTIADKDTSEGDTIRVWLSVSDINANGVSVGREQAQLLQKLISTSFTSKTNVNVSLSLVNSMDALIQSIASGTNPDVVMFTGESTPVTLAVRGAAEDLTKYEGFDELSDWFYPSAFISFAYGDGIYAVPDIQMFYLMYYRTDIFNELGLQPPQTWEEFYSVIKRLQQKNLEVGVSGNDQTIFETLLLQHGGQLYNSDLSKTMLTETNAITAFTKWTQLYTNYGLSVTFDFLSRFRSGEMPLGIMPLTMYNQLKASAPEINNLWAIMPVPGVGNEDGTITRTESCSVTGSLILSGAKNKADCFEYLKWWVSAETQTAFGIQTEASLGAASRYFTANKQAFYAMPWSAEETETLEAQWSDVTDMAQTPASYYVSRCITNAFRQVVYYNKNPREMMAKYASQMDEELTKKRKEFGLE